MTENIINNTRYPFSIINPIIEKIKPLVAIETTKRFKRKKTFIIGGFQINIKYDKELITYFVAKNNIKFEARGGNQ